MRRFSIGSMMLAVLVCGVAVAALRNADAWVGVMLLLTLGLLGTAVLGTIFGRNTTRAFWAGFTLFGGGYLTLTMGPGFAQEVGPRLVTTQALDVLHDRLAPSPALSESTPRYMTDELPEQVSVVMYESLYAHQSNGRSYATFRWPLAGGREQFRPVGQCLFTLSAGLVGGLIARRFHRAAAAAG